MTDFLISAITNKEIVVIDNLKEVNGELKSIGNNLNQLTTLCNMGRITNPNIDCTKGKLNDIYETLNRFVDGSKHNGNR